MRDSAALLDATAGPDARRPVPSRPPPPRPFADEVGADPGRLRIGFTDRTAEGVAGAPGLRRRAATTRSALLRRRSATSVVEVDLPGLTPEVGAAIGTVFNAATAWIVGYWIRRLGRRPATTSSSR